MAYFDKYGVEFTDDRKTLVKCPKDFEGEYIIPNGVMYIYGTAFEECRKLISVIIPDSVIRIGTSAFQDCTNLTTVVIPKSVKTICTDAFAGCSSLTIHLHEGIEYEIDYMYVEDGAFAYVANIIYNGKVSQNEKRGFGIYRRAINGYKEGNFIFSDITKKELCVCLSKSKGEIFIPEGVQTIEPFAFWDCNSITKIHIPTSLQKIFIEEELANCTNLEEIIVPFGQKNRFSHMDGLRGFEDRIFEQEENQIAQKDENPEKFAYSKAFELYSHLDPKMDNYFHHGTCDGKLFVAPAEQDEFQIFWNQNCKLITENSGVFDKNCNMELLITSYCSEFSVYFYYIDDNDWNSAIFKYNTANDEWSCCKIISYGML